jgi:hypothetical protein
MRNLIQVPPMGLQLIKSFLLPVIYALEVHRVGIASDVASSFIRFTPGVYRWSSLASVKSSTMSLDYPLVC